MHAEVRAILDCWSLLPYSTNVTLKGEILAAIAQSVSVLDFNFQKAVVGSILTVGKKVQSEISECNNSGYKVTGLTCWP